MGKLQDWKDGEEVEGEFTLDLRSPKFWLGLLVIILVIILLIKQC